MRKLHSLKYIALATFLAIGLNSNTYGSDTSTQATNGQTSGFLPAKEGKTIYVNISGLASRSQHAKKLTKLHKEQAAFGWSVVNVMALVENGDLEGFYVTYTRESY